MAKYFEDFSPSEIDENCSFDSCFSFAGETNVGGGLDIDNFREKVKNYSSDEVKKYVNNIIKQNHERYI